MPPTEMRYDKAARKVAAYLAWLPVDKPITRWQAFRLRRLTRRLEILGRRLDG